MTRLSPTPQLWRRKAPLPPLEQQPAQIVKLGEVLDGFERQLPRVILADDCGDDCDNH
jgi:hypothetical protein